MRVADVLALEGVCSGDLSWLKAYVRIVLLAFGLFGPACFECAGLDAVFAFVFFRRGSVFDVFPQAWYSGTAHALDATIAVSANTAARQSPTTVNRFIFRCSFSLWISSTDPELPSGTNSAPLAPRSGRISPEASRCLALQSLAHRFDTPVTLPENPSGVKIEPVRCRRQTAHQRDPRSAQASPPRLDPRHHVAANVAQRQNAGQPCSSRIRARSFWLTGQSYGR